MTPLGRAARTASVSFRETITPERLRTILITGKSSEADTPYVHALLDDAPISLLASVAEQLQDDAGSSATVWSNYRNLARYVKSSRDIWR